MNSAETEEIGKKKSADGESTIRLVRQILRTRRHREAIFGCKLFGEPAWDLLLELYRAELEERRVSVSGVAFAASIPQTTAGRSLEKLERFGLIRREDDPFDARRTWVILTKKGSSAISEVVEMTRLRPV